MRSPEEDEPRLIIVDDDHSVLRVTERILALEGYRIVGCTSGHEALRVLEQQAFDAMLCDVQMPGMDGIQVLRSIRTRGLDLPVVLISGQADLDSAVAAVEYGARRYLIKPVPAERLRIVVEEAVRSGRVNRAVERGVAEIHSGTFRVGSRPDLEGSLRRAMASLWMAYQPIVWANGGGSYGLEALLRTGEATLPNPSTVLNAAESVQRVHGLGRLVREQVASDMSNLVEGTDVFVNIHPEDLLDETLYAASGPLALRASRVVLEISERASLEHVPGLADKVANLRALGFRLALDDLGGGYAGLSSFTLLEPEFVKLDMSLVRHVQKSATQQRVVRAMVEMCHDIGRLVICEGVESDEEREALAALGCDLLQGHLIGRPEPLSAARSLRIAN
jgi:EAL domain-containing protein (putative c-di-GMP-specific phosphodiesterase class I)